MATIEELAIRPFKALQEHNLSAGYERSFKLSAHSISANRYLLGVDIELLPEEVLSDICNKLGMSHLQFDTFLKLSNRANLVLFGFDENNSDPVYKVYLEFWDLIRGEHSLSDDFPLPRLMHKGFKWRCLDPQSHVDTDYRYLTKMGVNATVKRMQDFFPHKDSKIFQQIKQAVRLCFDKQADAEYIFLEVSETQNDRKSFDINLYPADLQIRDIANEISAVANHFAVDSAKVDRLMRLVENKTLGHLSGGCGRDGEEYLTVYYEQ